METDIRKNPALLKLDLYCVGVRLDDSCLVEEHGGRIEVRSSNAGASFELRFPQARERDTSGGSEPARGPG